MKLDACSGTDFISVANCSGSRKLLCQRCAIAHRITEVFLWYWSIEDHATKQFLGVLKEFSDCRRAKLLFRKRYRLALKIGVGYILALLACIQISILVRHSKS